VGMLGVLNALWYPWFGIARLHWGCWDADGGSNECRAARKVVSSCITVVTFVPCAALLLSVHQFMAP